MRDSGLVRSRSRTTKPRLVRLATCSALVFAAGLGARAAEVPPHSPELDRMIQEQAKKNNVPESLVRRIVMRESKYDPGARNHKYWGLMQISYPTAKSMGFKGSPNQLLDPLVNLTYAVPYLANAFVIAGKREDEAVRLYASGYYWTARKRGLIGLLHGADPSDAPPTQIASIDPQAGVYGSLPPSPQMVAATPVAVMPPSAMDLEATKDAVELVADKDGSLHPPKKWRRDGGVTQVARGDQGLENVVAYSGRAESSSRKSARRSHKATEFASIDVPAGAQAYAADAAQDPRFAQAPSQAAIAQATAPQEVRPATFYAQGAVGEPPAAAPDPRLAAADPQAAGPTSPAAASDDAPRAHEHATRRAKHHADGKSSVAKSESGKTETDKGARAAAKRIARHGKPQSVAAADDHSAEAAPADVRPADAPTLRP